MTNDCLFCAIVAGEVPGTVVYQDSATVAFRDVAPVAPTHVLVVTREHLANLAELGGRPELAAALVAAVRATAAALQLAEFRTVFNTGPSAGQTVEHVHAHLLSGRQFSWPPG